MLAGGHPNSLGRTVEVVNDVLADPDRIDELFDCYGSDDEVVRLRTSSALKRIFKEKRSWFQNHADRIFGDMATFDQPSAKWTTAQIFHEFGKDMTVEQRKRATEIMVMNLHEENDWIALNMTMKTLQHWLKYDAGLRPRIERRIVELADDPRKSVANGARKVLKVLDIKPI